MDWRMMENATGSTERLQTLYYLLNDRYQLNAIEAAEHLKKEMSKNALCLAVIQEAKAEMKHSANNLRMGQLFTDAAIRSYLSDLLDALKTVK
jgi:hypothetical protein